MCSTTAATVKRIPRPAPRIQRENLSLSLSLYLSLSLCIYWECGVLPAPEPGDVPEQPPAAPAESEPGDGTIEEGATVYTDASAMRPNDLPLRRAACTVWVGEGSRLNTACLLRARSRPCTEPTSMPWWSA